MGGEGCWLSDRQDGPHCRAPRGWTRSSASIGGNGRQHTPPEREGGRPPPLSRGLPLPPLPCPVPGRSLGRSTGGRPRPLVDRRGGEGRGGRGGRAGTSRRVQGGRSSARAPLRMRAQWGGGAPRGGAAAAAGAVVAWGGRRRLSKGPAAAGLWQPTVTATHPPRLPTTTAHSSAHPQLPARPPAHPPALSLPTPSPTPPAPALFLLHRRFSCRRTPP